MTLPILYHCPDARSLRCLWAVEEAGIDRQFFDPAGKINGAASDTADGLNQSYARHLAGMDEPSERLDAQAMFDLTGSRHYVSGLYTPGTVMLQPAGYIRGLGQGLRRAKRRAALLTALCDLGGVWSLDEVTGALTRLADRAVDLSIRRLVAEEIRRGKLPGAAPEEAQTGAGMVALACQVCTEA